MKNSFCNKIEIYLVKLMRIDGFKKTARGKREQYCFLILEEKYCMISEIRRVNISFENHTENHTMNND
jgi:hypothetical protein